MVKDIEMKTIAEMTEVMVKILHENGINPMQAMNLVGYAARQVVTDISRSVLLTPEQAIITALGGMLPEGYLRELAGSAQRPSDGCGCMAK